MRYGSGLLSLCLSGCLVFGVLTDALAAIAQPASTSGASSDLPLMDSTSGTEGSQPWYAALNQRIQNEITDDEPTVTRDLAVLWQAAVERNNTIRFAIEKLSRKDATGKQPVDPWTKKLISSLVNLGGVAGSVITQSPVGILGSGVVQEAISDGPPDMSRMPITDADMVILAKTVDELQTQLFRTYLAYQRDRRLLKLSREASREIKRQLSQGDNPTIVALLDVTDQDVLRYEQAYASARTALTLLAGPEAVAVVEQPVPQK